MKKKYFKRVIKNLKKEPLSTNPENRKEFEAEITERVKAEMGSIASTLLWWIIPKIVQLVVEWYLNQDI